MNTGEVLFRYVQFPVNRDGLAFVRVDDHQQLVPCQAVRAH
jgi:hypothetical protein